MFSALLVLVLIVEPGKEAPAKNPKLTGLAKDKIDRIKITRQDKQPILLVKKEGTQWQMTAPIHYPANPVHIETLLSVAQSESYHRYAAHDLAKFELEPPQVTLTLNDREVAFGGNDPLQYRRYVKLEDTVHLIDDTPFHTVTSDYTELLDLHFLVENSEIEKIILPDGQVIWQSQEKKWQTEPGQPDLSQESLTSWISEWKHLQVFQISAYQKKAETSDNGKEIQIYVKGREKPLLFAVLKQDGRGLSLAREEIGLQYELAGEVADRLMKLPDPPKKEAVPETDNKLQSDHKPQATTAPEEKKAPDQEKSGLAGTANSGTVGNITPQEKDDESSGVSSTEKSEVVPNEKSSSQQTQSGEVPSKPETVPLDMEKPAEMESATGKN